MGSAGSQTLLALGEDENRLGAQLGITAVLNTWTRDLRFHPHPHCIVTGGRLTRDGRRWKATRQDYLFPVSVLSALFRGKLVAALDEAYRDGRLDVRRTENGTENGETENGTENGERRTENGERRTEK